MWLGAGLWVILWQWKEHENTVRLLTLRNDLYLLYIMYICKYLCVSFNTTWLAVGEELVFLIFNYKLMCWYPRYIVPSIIDAGLAIGIGKENSDKRQHFREEVWISMTSPVCVCVRVTHTHICAENPVCLYSHYLLVWGFSRGPLDCSLVQSACLQNSHVNVKWFLIFHIWFHGFESPLWEWTGLWCDE